MVLKPKLSAKNLKKLFDIPTPRSYASHGVSDVNIQSLVVGLRIMPPFVVTALNRVRAMIKRYTEHWFTLVSVIYLVVWLVQHYLVVPIETHILKNNVAIVSVVYLPHAIRVLATWMLGPKAALALIPISLITFYIGQADTANLALYDYAVAVIGGVCAPLAFELMRLVKINVYPKNVGIISWRTLVFAGFLSSILNSFFQTVFLEGKFPIEDTLSILSRFVIGDVMGLVIVLTALVLALRFSRGFSNV